MVNIRPTHEEESLEHGSPTSHMRESKNSVI